MSEPLKIKLRTLTPLWTGGVDGKSERLHVTGIMGSLRWWYEALVRGLGGKACDPTDTKCQYDSQSPEPLEKQLCPACRLFGATGWRRRFRLVVRDTTRPDGPTGTHRPTGDRFKRDGKTRPSWYFNNGPGRGGTITVSVIPLASDFDPNVILGLFELIELHAGLAAKTQLGYGWIKIGKSPSLNVPAFVQAMQSAAAARPGDSEGLPSLKEMFFAQIETKDQGITATLNLKYDFRAAFRNAFGGNKTLRHSICGTVKDGRQASKISLSQAVNGTMRVWGWIPEDLRVPNVTRSQVVDEIKATIKIFGALKSWREYDPSQVDGATFLTSLLEKGGRQ